MAKSNAAAAATGDLRAALETLRNTLAELLDSTEANVHAQLAAQYRATLADLAALPDTGRKSASERLQDRVAAAVAAPRTA